MLEDLEHLLCVTPREEDQRFTFHNSVSILEGGLGHKLVQRGALKLRRLLQSGPGFRRNAGRDAALVFNCRWHSVVWRGAMLTPLCPLVGSLATKRRTANGIGRRRVSDQRSSRT